jgi:GTP-sensing pleiotropic transcriptional regulator CodY
MANAIRSILAILAVAAAGQALAYQVTGEVKDVSDTSITVVQEKGKNKGEKFEMARDASTKVSGDLKKGAKVTVEYTLTAKSIEAKAEKAEKPKKK